MSRLSNRSLQSIASWYRRTYGLSPLVLSPSGVSIGAAAASPVERLNTVQRTRLHALHEGVRWGEPYSFFVAPGLISWVVPVVNRFTLLGGVFGGEVLAESDEDEVRELVQHFVDYGASADDARSYLSTLSVWPQPKCRCAAEQLYEMVYRVTGFIPDLLNENYERHQQQRQIAEEIHRRKLNPGYGLTADDERKLLALIRVGDHKGARRILNQLLGSMFFRSANLTVIRAFMIEMMGYLVRRVVEESPFLEPIMEKNHRWMTKILAADTFESLSAVLRMALDDFMRNIYEMASAESDPRFERAMAYLAANYKRPIRVEEVAAVAEVSPVRIAHLIKERTGKSVIAHVHAYRLQEARRLLEETDASCADIAVRVGFCDQSYFTKQFRAHVDVTPACYRRQLRRAQSTDTGSR